MGIKYTTDNKKVVVIGSLNAQEKIVQEVFISDGSEIPSGEHFVVKSLHDEPVISWKEKHLKEVEDGYDSRRKSLEREFDLVSDSLKKGIARLRGIKTYNTLVEKSLDSKSLENVINFLENKIKYVIKIDYNTPSIIKFKDFNMIYDREEMKLLSLFGRDDGTMTFKLHQYPDGSGGYSYTEILPFCDYESAYEKFKELIVTGAVNEEIINLAKKHNLKLDDGKIQKYKESRTKDMEKNIKNYEQCISKWKEEVAKINELC
jgi:hypothetical protein